MMKMAMDCAIRQTFLHIQNKSVKTFFSTYYSARIYDGRYLSVSFNLEDIFIDQFLGKQVTACGYLTGLTVLVKASIDDYHSSFLSSFGFRVSSFNQR